MWVKAIPLFKCCTTVFKVYSVSKKLGDKAAIYLTTSNITKKKFRNTVPTPSGTGCELLYTSI